MARIILVRHGQTEWNRVERFRGQADVPLNATGLAQAQATGRRVAATWRPVAVYASPLSRAVQTAQAIAQHFDLTVHPQTDLMDIDYGKWRGLTPAEVSERWPDVFYAWQHTPHTAQIPEGETLTRLRARGMAAVHRLVDRHAGQTFVIVGHTVINRVLLLGMLGLGNDRFWHLGQQTCAINVIEVREGDFVLISLNDTCHLAPNSIYLHAAS